MMGNDKTWRIGRKADAERLDRQAYEIMQQCSQKAAQARNLAELQNAVTKWVLALDEVLCRWNEE